MANKDNNENDRSILKTVSGILNNLSSIGTSTSHATYGVTKDVFETDKLLSKITSLQEKNKDTVKKSIDGNNFANSRLNSFGMLMGDKDNGKRYDKDGKVIKGSNVRKPDSVFDIISSRDGMFGDLRQQLLISNKFQETIAEYEMLRRAIPEVSRVINLLINNVLVPDIITTNTFNLKYDFDNAAESELAKRIREKHELDSKIRVIVENYFIIGVEYITVIPYKSVINSIKSRDSMCNSKKNIIKESSLGDYSINPKSKILTESVFLDMMEESLRDKFREQVEADKDHSVEFNKLEKTLNEHVNTIKIYKSNKKLVYDEALVETIMEDSESFLLESSFEEYLGKSELKVPKNMTKSSTDDGVVNTDAEDYDKMNIRGCKIERLDPSRIWPIRLHDTVVAYVYIEERRDESMQYNLQNQMKNSFSFYRTQSCSTDGSNAFMMKQIEDRILNDIGSKVLCSLSPKFVEANFKDMDIFYEFLRDNDLHKYRHDIILLHPDDVVEFKRTDGSIMKNAVFFLKLYLLLVLNNILTKVRKGSDRTMYYVSNGLSNDIEGAVQEAIEAICQSEIRVSDVGTIQGVMGAIGATVDLFVPQTADGDSPIRAEVVSGQTVDMDEEFLKWIMKSITLSFNLPSIVVDLTNEVDFAKSLSMANMDVAMSSALSQSELNPMLTKLVKKVMAYELDITQNEIDTISATLIPPRSMLMQLTNDLLNTTKDLATTMADINVTDDGSELLKKLFIKSFVRENLNYEWDNIDVILANILKDEVESSLKDEAKTGELDMDITEDDLQGGV